jgi:hypothetical protein
MANLTQSEKSVIMLSTVIPQKKNITVMRIVCSVLKTAGNEVPSDDTILLHSACDNFYGTLF